MSRGLCAYAITRDRSLDPGDMPDPEVHLITHRGLGLVVAEVELEPFAELETDTSAWMSEPTEDDPLVVLARRHDDVVRAVFEHQPVLPLRFGTVMRDRDAAVRLLADRHELAKSRLDRVEGHREWGVRAQLVKADEPDDVPTDGLSGTAYLLMRRKRLATAEGTRRRGSELAESLHDALARYATDSTHRARRAPGLVLDAAYLVADGQERAFHAESKATGPELSVEVTGPWPPYSFTDLELATAHA